MQDKQLPVIDEVQEVIQIDKPSHIKGGNQGNANHIPRNNATGTRKGLILQLLFSILQQLGLMRQRKVFHLVLT